MAKLEEFRFFEGLKDFVDIDETDDHAWLIVIVENRYSFSRAICPLHSQLCDTFMFCVCRLSTET